MLNPVLFYLAAIVVMHFGVVLVAAVFGAVTIVTMLVVVLLLSFGLARLELRLHQHHEVAAALPGGDPMFRGLLDNYLDAFEKTGLLEQLRKKWLEDGAWIAALVDRLIEQAPILAAFLPEAVMSEQRVDGDAQLPPGGAAAGRRHHRARRP